MALINFPTATANGQEFEAPNGVIYTYVGTPPNGYWSGNTQDGLSGLDSRFLKLDASNSPITGNLGIGTATPQETLTIVDANEARISLSQDTTTNEDSYGSIVFRHSVAGNKNAKIESVRQGGSSGGALGFYTRTQGDSINLDGGQERLRITSDGKVGIGTTVPVGKLEISSATAYAPGSSFNNGCVLIGNSSSKLAFSYDSTNEANITALDPGVAWKNLTLNAGNTVIKANSAERMRIASDGNIGIGTTNPQAELHVTGHIYTTEGINFDATDDNYGVYPSGSQTLTFRINNDEKLRIRSDGKVGIGTTDPSQLLEIASTAPNIRLTDTIDGHSEIDGNAGNLKFNADKGNEKLDTNITFAVDNSEKLRIDSDGNVGIGTTGPDMKLVVSEPSSSSTGARMKFENSGERGVTLGFIDHNANPVWGISNGSQSSNFLTIDGSGNVGIGVDDATEKLEVDGNIVVTGTVDGRDVAADGSKLDSISAGATGDQTAAEILTLLKTVDGSGSGLDADLLDGLGSSTAGTGNTICARNGSGDGLFRYVYGSYLNMNHSASDRNSDTIFYSSNDDFLRKNTAAGFRTSLNVPTRTGGDASGTWGINITGSAGTLDGLDSTQFLRSDVDDTATGTVTFNGTVNIRTALDLADNDILRFGSGDDAEFFCNGSHFFLDLNSGIGNFYIRDGATTRFTFDDAGSFTATGDITAFSDINLKDNIEVIPDALNKVSQLRGVTYERNDMDGERQSGVIAQEVEAVLPEVVRTNEDGIKSVAYGNLVGLLIESIKELKAEIEELKVERN